jgi:predicted dehydrogenase
MTERIGWGILGTGGIAHVFADAIAQSDTGTLAAVSSRDAAKAEAFATETGAARAHASHEALLADPAVRIVYVSTLHPYHVELAIAAAQAGKHVLCEKPIAMTASGAERVIEAARAAKVFLMEAFAFRLHPQTARLMELIEGGAIGEVRMMSLAWGFDFGSTDGSGYHLDHGRGGGSILDNGCYPVAFARRVAGPSVGRVFRDPDQVVGTGLLHPESNVDWDAQALLWWEGGISAQISGTLRTEIDKTVLILGRGGLIRLPAPYLPLRPDRFGGVPRIIVERQGREPQEIAIDVSKNAYVIEADRVAGYVREGRTEAPEYAWDDILGNMRTLDRWRAAIGVRYPADDLVGTAAAS